MKISNHYARSAAIVTLAAAALQSACTDPKQTLLDAPIITVIDTSAASSAAGADALRIGALSRLRSITAGSGAGDSPWMFSGLLTDEWKSSDTFSQRNETDQRQVQDNNANLTPIERDLYRARTSAREAINALVQYAPTPAANIGQMYMVMATAELYIAEWICNGAPISEADEPAASDERRGLHRRRGARRLGACGEHRDRRVLGVGAECCRPCEGSHSHRAGQVPRGRLSGCVRAERLPIARDVLADVGQQSDLVVEHECQAVDGRRQLRRHRHHQERHTVRVGEGSAHSRDRNDAWHLAGGPRLRQ